MSRPSSRSLFVLIGLAVAVIGLAAATLIRYPDKVRLHWDRLTRPPEVVDMGGYQISLRDRGQGTPTVIIEGGVDVEKGAYHDLQLRLAQYTRVISYDRAGVGESTASGAPRTLPNFTRELEALLEKLQVPPPYILVGHSLGGHIIRYHASVFPERVAGLVFLDHPHEDWFRYIRATWPKAEADAYFKGWPTDPSKVGPKHQELLTYERNCDLVRGIQLPPDIPVLMFTGNNRWHFRQGIGQERDRQEWLRLQKSLLTGVKDARHIVDWETGHWAFFDKPDMVEREIADFIEKCRQHVARP